MILEASYVKETCKIGEGFDCCRFLVCGPKGFECAKFTEHRALLDFRATNKLMTARADNCEGKPMYDEQEEKIIQGN